MTATYPALAKAAKYLKNAAPREYMDLVRELDAICHDMRTALVRAEQTAILNVQGRAQQADDFLNAFDPPQPKVPSTPIGP